MRVGLYVDGGLFCFEEKFTSSADSKTIIRRFSIAADFYRILVYDIFVGLGVATFVGYVPAKSFEKRVYEFATELRFVISLVL